MNNKILNNKKFITVLGGSGFLGSHISDILTSKGYRVTIVDKTKSEWLNKKQIFFKADLNTPQDYQHILKKSDYVFNFAAIADIEEANQNPIKTAETNIFSLVKILDLCSKFKVKRFIQASSVYVSGEFGGFYKSSKVAAESFIKEFFKIRGLKYSILRYGTLYGPRSNESNGLHNIIKKAIKNKKIVYSGNKNSVRSYIHVLDAARISLRALDKNFENKTVIITGPENININFILRAISEISGIKKISIIKKNKSKIISHYVSTPYNLDNENTFTFKYSDNFNIELGQGLKDLIKELKKKYQWKKRKKK